MSNDFDINFEVMIILALLVLSHSPKRDVNLHVKTCLNVYDCLFTLCLCVSLCVYMLRQTDVSLNVARSQHRGTQSASLESK